MIESVLMAGAVETATILASWPPMQKFYLSGGTALALQEGHRRSKDLDFFTRHPVEALPALPKLDNLLKRFTRAEQTYKSPKQINWRLDGVSVTLLAYPFAHDFEFHTWRGLAVADVRDIAVQKAYTVGRRVQARDYIDLHAIEVHMNVYVFRSGATTCLTELVVLPHLLEPTRSAAPTGPPPRRSGDSLSARPSCDSASPL